jgi:hypothetical protein
LDINLLCSHPNTTRLLQQLDVATFRPLTLGWKTSVPEWHRKNSDKILNKEWFAPVLHGVLKKYSLDCPAVLGFQVCDLYPWDSEDTDFSKCLGGKTNQKCTIQKLLQKHSIQNVKELVANQVLTELKIREGKK